MVQRESRRSAERVDFKAPVQMLGPAGPVDADIRDLSRTGVRIRLPAAAFHEVSMDLLNVTGRLLELIGPSPTVHLHAQMLGPLVSRAARTTRVILPREDGDAVEVGCCFDRPLTDEEIAMLGVALPEHVAQDPPPEPELVPDVSEDDATQSHALHIEIPQPASVSKEGESDRRRVRYRAHVAGRGISMECDASSMSPEAIVLLVKRSVVQHGNPELNMIKIVSRLSSRFGERVRLRVNDGTHDLWGGAARISGVDVPNDGSDMMRVTLSFPAPLTPSECAKARI